MFVGRILNCILLFILMLRVNTNMERVKRQISFPGQVRPSGTFAPNPIDEGPQKSTSNITPVRVSCVSDENQSGYCVYISQCAIQYNQIIGTRNKQNYCFVKADIVGICCPISNSKDDNVNNVQLFSTPVPTSVLSSRIGNEDVIIAERLGRTDFTEYNRIGNSLIKANAYVQRGTPDHGHLLFFKTTEEAVEIGEKAYSQLLNTKQLVNRLGINPVDSGARFGVNDFECPKVPRCSNSVYRSADGSCNNLQNPKWGQSMTAMQRILEPVYADGTWEPRQAQNGKALPSPRLVSQSIIRDENHPHRQLTLAVMQWGQFLDHDLASAPIFRLRDKERLLGIECCENGLESNQTHPACLPIRIPDNDVFYASFGQKCMNFVRSMLAPRSDCSFGYAEQMDQLTQFLDGSMVYGSTSQQAKQLRDVSGGRLRFQIRNGFKLPPLEDEAGDECTIPEQNIFCLKAGDDRINEQPGLTTEHTVWLREHNRIANQLSLLNPSWNDETLYQESRKINIAQIQHITYNEWLPIVVGQTFMKTYKLIPLQDGYFTGYNPTINPSINNEFAAAAFRLGHTLVQGVYQLRDVNRNLVENVTLHKNFNRVNFLHRPTQVADFIRTLTSQPIQQFDSFITRSLTNFLFEGREGFGMDLVSLNIQRAREHGIRGYTSYKALCQGKKIQDRAKDFSQLLTNTPSEIVNSFSKVYKHVDDIDLFIGMVTEKPHPGALLGPTMLCIVGDQFARFRHGDRFFYDIGNQAHSFTENQLNEIRKVSVSRIYCNNGDNVQELQPLAFWMPDRDLNPLLPCTSDAIPMVNLRYWATRR